MIKYVTKTDASFVRVNLTEEKTSRFTGSEIFVGAGPKNERTQRKNVLLARKVIALAKQNKVKRLQIDFDDYGLTGEDLAVNFEMANYEFVSYKSKPEPDFVELISLSGPTAQIERGQIIVEEISASRSLSNTPPGLMTPSLLAEKIKEAAKGTAARVKVLDRDDMKILGMGGVLGVSQGSSEEPKFIIIEYFGTNKKDRPIVLVGKGVTFDSGGLNIKPGDHMNDMHLDMSGGAAVAHALIAAAKLKLKKNIVVLIPAVENMPSGSSYRPGDVLKSLSGQTIEIGNTDAEGRVILADALTYAQRFNPSLVIDVATLTGAAEVALGQRASAIFCMDEKLLKKFQDLGEQSGDYVWPLPMWDEYDEEIKGTFGDWSNIGKTRWGGAIHGAVFLKQFVYPTKPPLYSKGEEKEGNMPFQWVHIDMAPRMLAIDGEYLAKGSAGAPIRLLVKILEEL